MSSPAERAAQAHYARSRAHDAARRMCLRFLLMNATPELVYTLLTTTGCGLVRLRVTRSAS
jgi:hypothetical protein